MNTYRKKLILIFSSLIAIFYVFVIFPSSDIFIAAEKAKEAIDNRYYSDVIDLNKEGVYTWEIKRDDWLINNEKATIELVLDRTEGVPAERYRKENMELRMNIRAYTLDEDDKKISRTNFDWYWKSDPLNPESKMCSSGGSETINHCLASINNFSDEDLYVDIDIIKNDNILSGTNPKLKLEGDHDYAIIGWPINEYKYFVIVATLLFIIFINSLLFREWSKVD